MTELKNQRHELFCQNYAGANGLDYLNNAAKSYKNAGYKTKSGIRQNGRRLITKDYIRQRIAELKEELKQKRDKSREEIHLTNQDRLRSIIDIRDKCLAKGDLATAARFEDMLNKHTGFYEKDNEQQRDTVELSDDENRLLEDLNRQYKIRRA